MNLNISIPETLSRQYTVDQIRLMVEKFLQRRATIKEKEGNPAQMLLHNFGRFKNVDFSDISEDDLYLQED